MNTAIISKLVMCYIHYCADSYFIFYSFNHEERFKLPTICVFQDKGVTWFVILHTALLLQDMVCSRDWNTFKFVDGCSIYRLLKQGSCERTFLYLVRLRGGLFVYRDYLSFIHRLLRIRLLIIDNCMEQFCWYDNHFHCKSYKQFLKKLCFVCWIVT